MPSAYGNFWRHFPGARGHRAGRLQRPDRVGARRAQAKPHEPAPRGLGAGRPATRRRASCRLATASSCSTCRSTTDGEKLLCLHLTQRSCDIALGIPYNIAGYCFLLELFARFSGIRAGIFAHTLVDAHIYTSKPDGSMAEYDHVPGLKKQLERTPRDRCRALPSIRASARSTTSSRSSQASTEEVMQHFVLTGYEPYPPIAFQSGGVIAPRARGRYDGRGLAGGASSGSSGTIPWRYPADLKRLKRLTLGTTVIMGRITWESIGSKPLPGRRNIVITQSTLAGRGLLPPTSLRRSRPAKGRSGSWAARAFTHDAMAIRGLHRRDLRARRGRRSARRPLSAHRSRTSGKPGRFSSTKTIRASRAAFTREGRPR